eukprot:5452477-Amphidinium_carterae.1
MAVPDEYRKVVQEIGREILSWKVQPATRGNKCEGRSATEECPLWRIYEQRGRGFNSNDRESRSTS